MNIKYPDPSTGVIHLSTQRGELGKENAHSTCEWQAPIEVKFNFVNRVIVIRNSGSSDSPSIVRSPARFKGSV